MNEFRLSALFFSILMLTHSPTTFARDLTTISASVKLSTDQSLATKKAAGSYSHIGELLGLKVSSQSLTKKPNTSAKSSSPKLTGLLSQTRNLPLAESVRLDYGSGRPMLKVFD